MLWQLMPASENGGHCFYHINLKEHYNMSQQSMNGVHILTSAYSIFYQYDLKDLMTLTIMQIFYKT